MRSDHVTIREPVLEQLPEEEGLTQLLHQERTIDQLSLLSLLAFTLVVLYFCYLLFVPFLAPIASALALAVLLTPLHRRIVSRVRNPGIAAGISVTVAIVAIALPILLLVQTIIAETINIVGNVSALIGSGAWRTRLANLPWLFSGAEWINQRFDVPQIAGRLSTTLAGTLPSLVQGSGAQIVAVIVMLYFLFYMVRDRVAALAFLVTISPLPRERMHMLYAQIADTVRATVFGTLTVSFVQGALGGLMFWALGLPAPLLWAVAMAMFAVVPVLGTFVVWVPAVIYLFATGQTGHAVILLVWGMVVIGMIDNLLYPMLVGTRLRVHTSASFISLVGGVIAFGAAGLILGPIVLTTAPRQ
jgi:predicted PurR-regulated permease PerM